MENPKEAAKFPATAVITGATSGFGRHTARALAARGVRLLLLGRDERRGRETLEEIRAHAAGASVEMILADLSSIAEVQRVAEEIAARVPSVNLLLNNAGAVFGIGRSETVDGLEATFALNHLAYFQLTLRLEEQLRRGAPARVVNVASDAYTYAGGRFDFDDPQATRRYRVHRQYGASKLANLLFTRELARRLEGSDVGTVAWSPKGLTATRFAYGAHRLAPLVMRLMHPFSLSTESAVVSLIELCCEPIDSANLGRYSLGGEWVDVPVCNDEDAARLWELSAELTGAGQPPTSRD